MYSEELYDLSDNPISSIKAKDEIPDSNEPLPATKRKRVPIKKHNAGKKGKPKHKDGDFNPKTGTDKRRKQLERNRKSAKESRRKKKLYIQELEIQVINY